MSTDKTNSKNSWLLVDHSENAKHKEIEIEIPFVVGRREKSNLFLRCISVSGKHAEIVQKNDDLWINDLQSTNGTFVNGVRISEATQLNADDLVQFGSIVFRVARQTILDNQEGATPRNAELSELSEIRFNSLLRDGVVPFFQPVFNISENVPQLSGYEILSRGRLDGLCTPEEMFTAAQEMEKTAELSESLRERGLEVADANFSSGKMIFVNTHPSEISSDRLGESLAKIRIAHPDRKFTLELPAAILGMPESMSVIEAATKGMNIDLSIYGFQPKSIRLADLQRLAPKVVKFSSCLVRDIQKDDQRQRELVKSMIKMLVELDIQPMAEMVETSEEHEAVKLLGFELAQGFYYGRPSSVDDCLEKEKVDDQQGESSTLKSESPTPKSLSETSDHVDEAKTPEALPKLVKDENDGVQWLNSQEGHCYTVQLMVTSERKIAEEYIKEQELPEQFVIVPEMGTRRHLFAVFHGSFADRATASETSRKFKNSNYYPLVRKFLSIQAEVEKTREKSSQAETV